MYSGGDGIGKEEGKERQEGLQIGDPVNYGGRISSSCPWGILVGFYERGLTEEVREGVPPLFHRDE
jgi:hypothetical protein